MTSGCSLITNESLLTLLELHWLLIYSLFAIGLFRFSILESISLALVFLGISPFCYLIHWHTTFHNSLLYIVFFIYVDSVVMSLLLFLILVVFCFFLGHPSWRFVSFVGLFTEPTCSFINFLCDCVGVYHQYAAKVFNSSALDFASCLYKASRSVRGESLVLSQVFPEHVHSSVHVALFRAALDITFPSF